MKKALSFSKTVTNYSPWSNPCPFCFQPIEFFDYRIESYGPEESSHIVYRCKKECTKITGVSICDHDWTDFYYYLKNPDVPGFYMLYSTSANNNHSLIFRSNVKPDIYVGYIRYDSTLYKTILSEDQRKDPLPALKAIYDSCQENLLFL